MSVPSQPAHQLTETWSVPVLSYAEPPPVRRTPWWLRIARLLTATAAGATVGLPFAYGTSPAEVASHFIRDLWSSPDTELMRLAAPFFLGFPLAWVAVRDLFRYGFHPLNACRPGSRPVSRPR